MSRSFCRMPHASRVWGLFQFPGHPVPALASEHLGPLAQSPTCCQPPSLGNLLVI